MSVAFEMLKAAEKAGFNNFDLWCEGEELATVDTASEAWEHVNSVDVCEIHMHSPKFGNEWVLIIPELDDDEDIADHYAEGWVTNWFQGQEV
jgi:hypothetical protein